MSCPLETPLRLFIDSTWSADDHTEMRKQVEVSRWKLPHITVVWHPLNPHKSSQEIPKSQQGEENRKEAWGNLFLALR